MRTLPKLRANGRLHGKVALVTGAAQGIGRAIAETFMAEGARVIASDINTEKLRELSASESLLVYPLDVTDEHAIAACAARHTNVDVLVNCAGYVATGSILTASRSDLDRSHATNVASVFTMTKAFLPKMVERRDGCIINIASVVSTEKSAVERCVYATTKGAVIALTRSIALDLIKLGVRCNSISPGTIHTPSLDERMAASPDPQGAMNVFIGRQPIGRLGEATEIAAVAVLMASNEARFMTGTNVVIDGGFSL